MYRSAIKKIVQANYVITNPVWRLICPEAKRNILAPRALSQPRAEAFQHIYSTNEWQSEQTVSGVGSTLSATVPLRRRLPPLLRRLSVKDLLDAPCGDFHWMRHVQLDDIRYIGADIVPELIDMLDKTWGSASRRFMVLDIVKDRMPPADLWLCRDALFHISNDDIIQVFTQFARSKVSFILTSTYPLSTHNPDVEAGGFRTINLRLPPFSLPKPLEQIDDFVPTAPPRVLALWSVSQIVSWLESRR